MSNLSLGITFGGKDDEYLRAAAEARGLTRTMLLRRILEVVIADKMVLSVLDDGDKPSAKKPKAPGTMGQRIAAQVHRPSTFNLSSSNFTKRAEPKTRAQLEAELHQAVLNTKALPVE